MKKIIATIGPSLLHKTSIKDIHNSNIIYRINGAHGNISTIEENILKIKKEIKNAKILIDLPGNKIRTRNLEYGYIDIEKDKTFEINFFQFTYKNLYKYIKKGDIVFANDSIFKFKVIEIDKKNQKIVFLSYSSGKLFNNKGFHIKGVSKYLPFLFEKDKELIKLSNKYNIDFIGLSFVRNENDIIDAKRLINTSTIIAKVETLNAVEHLDNILQEVDYILIDRGDLSTDVGLYNIAYYQQYIIQKALFHNKKIFLATQFLKSMEQNPIPTFPEIIDLYNTLRSGIYGIQLSEETAIGNHPKECIDVINKISNKIKYGGTL